MPRIVFVLIFLFLTITPFFLIKAAEIVLNVSAPVQETNKTNTTTNTGYRDHYHSGYYHRPYYGGFFYYGSRGRGGWLGRNYRRSLPSRSSSSGFFSGSSSRSYSGGSSSYRGGGFGSFGK